MTTLPVGGCFVGTVFMAQCTYRPRQTYTLVDYEINICKSERVRAESKVINDTIIKYKSITIYFFFKYIFTSYKYN